MHKATLIERLTIHAKLPDIEQAEALLGATLAGLGAAAPADVARDVADFLPDGLSDDLRHAPHATIERFAALAAHVAAGAGLPEGRTRDLLPAALAMIAEAIGPHAAAELADGLPGDVGRHLVAPGAIARPHPPGGGRPAQGRGLAHGRPGGPRPLAEARPEQLQSVAARDDPHRETRLASSPGTAAERQGTTLADGRPGSDPVPDR